MSDYPDTREAFYTLLEGSTHDGETITVYYQLTTDFNEHLPAVLVYNTGGTQGFLDRVDRIGVEVYGIGTQTDRIAESIRSDLAGRHHDVPHVGLLDSVAVEVTPHAVPYPDSKINNNSAVYRVTTRPV